MKRILSSGSFQKILFLTGLVVLTNHSNLVAQTALPKYSGYSAPSPSPGAPGESFNPPMSGSASQNTPQIGEWTRTAGRDESMVITGADFTRYSGTDEGKDSRFTVYGTSDFQKDASIQQLEKEKVIITLDKNIPAWSMFLIWPGNDAGYGAPIAVNKTDSWWIGPAKATRGSTTAVYGRNLAQYNDSTTSHVYIKATNGSGQWATVTKVNPYKVDFIVPANLANGDYEVWTHNGHGGEYGWSGPLKLTVNDGSKWSQVIFNVKNYGALGDGVADDTDAILRTLAAARNSFGSTVYFPEGSYMISNMLFPGNNTKWLGAGTDKTFIKCRSNFNSTDAMVFGSVNTFEISDLTFDTNNSYRGGHAEPIFLRGSSNVRLNNIVFHFPNYNVLQLDNTHEVFITNCKSIGRISFLGKCSQLFIDNCDFYLTNDTELALHSWGGLGISMTNSTCQDYNNSDPNNGAGWGKGRFFVATGNSGSGRYTYLGNNATYDLTVREEPSVDQNSGEQFLWEGFSAVWSGSSVSSSGATTTLSGFSESLEKPKVAVITKGRGLGQSRRLIAASGSTVTLESPWNIQPDASSTICVGHFVDRVVMYKNYIDGKAYAVSSPNPSASAGIEPYGGVLNFIADRNIVSEVRAGIANWSTQHAAGVDPNYFSLFVNNTILNCRWGIQNGLDMYRPAEIGLLGSMYRNNTITNTLQSGVVNTITPTSTPVLESFVYEHNQFSNVRSAFSAGGDLGLPMHFPGSNPAGMSAQTFYKNNFTSGASVGGITMTPKVALRENTFAGFLADYTGELPEPVVKSPIHVLEINTVKGGSSTAPFHIWNSGNDTINWKASSNTPWLTLSDTTGVIKDERQSSDITLTANAAQLSEGTYKSTISVMVGSAEKKYTVLLVVKASAGPQVAITSPSSGKTFTAADTINIAAEASDKDGSVTKVEYFAGTTKLGESSTGPFSYSWANVPAGTYSLTAKATDNAGLSTTSAPVSITVNSIATPLAPSITLASTASGTKLIVPATTILTAEATDADGTISKVEFFQGSTKLAEDLTSPYSFSWNDIPAGTYSITAKATDNSEMSTTSAAIEIIVASPLAPVVALTSPANSSNFIAPASTDITADASDADGTISKVEFFQGSTKLAEDLTSPFSFSWNDIPAGSYSITAKATDNSGMSTNSTAIEITVASPLAPVVALTSPANSSNFIAPASTVITADASDTDGTISKVEFFQGSTKLAEDLTSPYSLSWNDIPAGSYNITAKATDNSGLTATSAPVTIQVNAPALKLAVAPATVVMTLPAPNSTFTAPGSATLSANVTEGSSTITKVEFFYGTTKIGEDLTAPYYFTWHAIPAGKYSIVAKATDADGQVSLSAPLDIQVIAPVIAVAPVVTVASTSANALTAPASTTLTAEASDADGTIAKVEFFAGTFKLGEALNSPFRYTWSGITAGTYSVTAKATDNSGLTTTSAAIIVQVNAPVLAVAPTVEITTLPASNLVAPASTNLTAVANDADGSIAKVEFFAGNTKIGEDLSSPYNYSWNNIPAGSYSVTAKATDNSGLSTTSAAVTIGVNAPVVNATPIVRMTLPTPNSSFTAPASATLSAEASDLDGSVTKVEFFSGTVKVGEDLTSPYFFTWHNIPAGNYSITAKATDNLGLTSTSAPVAFQVTSPVVAVAPTVAMTLPAPNSVFTAPGSATLSAVATDADGSITKVEFFAGTNKIGEDLSSPYYFTWHNIPAGSYSITAKATDDSGLSTMSAPVHFQVNAPVPTFAPTVAMTLPSSNTFLTAPGSATLSAEANDSDGTIVKVEFFAGTTKIGEDLSSPYYFSWHNIPEGNYAITAKATDNSGLTTVSAPVMMAVSNPLNVSKSYTLTAYPNPFQQYLNIEFTSIEKTHASLQIFNFQGILLQTVYKGKVEAGETYRFQFDGGNLPNGTYISRLTCGSTIIAKQLILMR